MFYRHFLRIGKVLPNNIGTQNMENRMNGLRERLHRWRLKETEKMRDMTPEQKASYIVSYLSFSFLSVTEPVEVAEARPFDWLRGPSAS